MLVYTEFTLRRRGKWLAEAQCGYSARRRRWWRRRNSRLAKDP